MTRITFLAHSGFFIELSHAALLFDWWKGTLPEYDPEKPLLVFASHHHEDHFNPAIFSLDAACFLLGKDIRLTERNRQRWGISEDTAARCRFFGGGESLEILPGITVEALPSTDEGVAFLVTAEGRTFFHAGDLNWWHWEGEADAWNRNMEVNFKRYTAALAGRRLDLAMLPLDPRLEKSAFLGVQHFFEIADIRRFLPMHQWENFHFTAAFQAAFPACSQRTTPISANAQAFFMPSSGELIPL